MPSSLTNYRQWMQSHDLSITVDELPDGAHLLWISAKCVDRVNLYVLSWYGTLLYQMSSEQLEINTVGAYVMSCAGNVLTFCRYLQVELEERNIHVGIAISFNLELLPNNPFPAQLPGAQAAISTPRQCRSQTPEHHPRRRLRRGEPYPRTPHAHRPPPPHRHPAPVPSLDTLPWCIPHVPLGLHARRPHSPPTPPRRQTIIRQPKLPSRLSHHPEQRTHNPHPVRRPPGSARGPVRRSLQTRGARVCDLGRG
ncbi:hypothetical protein EDD18DRAFT_1200757 [Armillaria luteobubalina]|uniref:Uncharacterized protein n=1 Tax=Armillaria luteobubalina TaxID=153913 RepID=A0AA39UB93_9AGAR|nr:hypothetical protein EDD18DRAFT_1200757 [Armillaria luteobubalina]